MVIGCVGTVVAIVALRISRAAQTDSHRSADAAEASAQAARDTATNEAGTLELERKRHHYERTPTFEVGYELAGSEQDIPMISVTSSRTNPMTYATIHMYLEDVQGQRPGTAGLSQISEWAIAQVKPGDTYRAQVYRPDRQGGSTRICCRFTSQAGEVWEVSNVLIIPPVMLV